MSNDPWYQDGLAFQCTGCGDCCTGDPGHVWVNKAEIEAMAAAVDLGVAEFEQSFVRQVGIRKSLIEFANGDCVLFDGVSRHCRAYEQRPRQCRTWPFWESNLADPEAWDDTCRDCPGAGRGPIVPVGKITALLGKIRV